MTTWILIIMLYGGEFTSTHYPTKGTCEAALFEKTDNGNLKHIKDAQCVEEIITNNQ